MDGELIPAAPAHPLWARREGSLQPTRNEMQKGLEVRCHEILEALHTSSEDCPVVGAVSNREE